MRRSYVGITKSLQEVKGNLDVEGKEEDGQGINKKNAIALLAKALTIQKHQ